MSAHKSVAELGVIGRVEDMHRILDAETAGTLEYLEELTRDRGGRRGRSATRAPTSGMTYAVTRHATSRAGDPNPHDHVLIANVVEMLDERGGFKGADTALWREHLHAATAYGRLRSARVAVELGYGIVPDRGKSGRLGHWAIAGIPDEAMAIHSKRSGQIDEALGPGAATAYRDAPSRPAGPAPRSATNRSRTSSSVGTTSSPPMVSIVMSSPPPWASPTAPASPVTSTTRRWIVWPGGSSRLMAGWRRTRCSRRDVIVAAAPHLFGLDPAVLVRLVDKVLAHPSAVELEPKPTASERMYAPRCVIDTERAIAERARDRHQLGTAPALLTALVDTTIRRTEAELAVKLTASQRRAVTGVCTSGRSLDVIIGVAGAGKTTALRAVRDAFELERRDVIATATSGQAARTVGHDAGIDSYTVASLLARLEHGNLGLDPNSVVVLDEAGMTDDTHLLALITHTSAAGAKLILVGDDRQLSAVGPGGGLRALAERFGAASGNSPRTSANPTSPNAKPSPSSAPATSTPRSTGSPATSASSPPRTVTSSTAPSSTAGSPTPTEASTPSCSPGDATPSTDSTNSPAPRRGERGWLTGPEITAPGGTPYRAGDRVVTLAPISRNVVTSETGTVRRVDPDTGGLHIDFDNGRSYQLARQHIGSDKLAHGYAITVHRAQGATVDTAHTIEDGGGRELAYVSLSAEPDNTQRSTSKPTTSTKPSTTSPGTGPSNDANNGSPTSDTSTGPPSSRA